MFLILLEVYLFRKLYKCFISWVISITNIISNLLTDNSKFLLAGSDFYISECVILGDLSKCQNTEQRDMEAFSFIQE